MKGRVLSVANLQYLNFHDFVLEEDRRDMKDAKMGDEYGLSL